MQLLYLKYGSMRTYNDTGSLQYTEFKMAIL